MKPYENLTRLGKLRRTRQITQAALEAYGFTNTQLKLMVDAGNTTYRVKAVDANPTKGDIYEANCFSLRLHQPGYQGEGAVDSELEWLNALCDAGIPAPQPVLTKSGKFSIEISIPELPSRQCTMLRWVKGKMAIRNVRPKHLKAIGRLIARLHEHSSRWKPSSKFVRRHYDRNGLWGDDTGTNLTGDEVRSKIPRKYLEDFNKITTDVEQVMEDWGKGSNVYGLIHADLGTKANVLFHKGEARPIDFDDGAYGYWMYDLAIPLCDWEGEDVWSSFREALLEGYLELCFIPSEQIEKLELFQAAFRAVEIFYGTACIIHYPESTYWRDRREIAWKLMKRYLKRNSLS